MNDDELTLDEIRQRRLSGRWLYTPFGWLDKSDGELMALWSVYATTKSRLARAEDAEEEALRRDLDHAAGLAGTTTQAYLERLLRDRGARKVADARWAETHPAAVKRTPEVEFKQAPAVFEVKQAGIGEFRGLLAVYGNVDMSGDIIESGAFTKTLAEHAAKPYSPTGLLPLLYQHDTTRPIGVFTSLTSTNKGVAFAARINADTRDGAEALSNIRAGVLSGMSIGFVATKTGWKGNIRLLREVRLLEGSVVTLPANDLARIQSVEQ